MVENFRKPIVISGFGGSGKSTVAKIVAEKLGLQVRSGGDYIRELAAQMGYDPNDGSFQKYRKSNPEIDFKLDRMQFDSLKKGGIVLESRLGALYHPYTKLMGLEMFHKKIGVSAEDLLPPGKVLSIFLLCDHEVRYSRLAHRRALPIEQVRKEEETRHQADIVLYRKIYNLNPFYSRFSEYSIDTMPNSAEENAESIIKLYNLYYQK